MEVSPKVFPLWGALAAILLVSALPASAGESDLVLVPRADSPEHDYARMENSSLEECERKCRAQKECNAFTYNQIHNSCFLKAWVNSQLTFSALATTGVKLFPSVRPGGIPDNGTSLIVLSQTDSPGNDYSRIDDFSLEQCRGACESSEECNAFTFNHSRGSCFLKRSANRWTNFHPWALTGIKLSSRRKEATEPPPPPANAAE